jgi:hypothetical protein
LFQDNLLGVLPFCDVDQRYHTSSEFALQSEAKQRQLPKQLRSISLIVLHSSLQGDYGPLYQ